MLLLSYSDDIFVVPYPCSLLFCLTLSVNASVYFRSCALTKSLQIEQACSDPVASDRHAHDGVTARAVGEAYGCSRSQPVHLPLGGHNQRRQPHQRDQSKRHEGLFPVPAITQCI